MSQERQRDICSDNSRVLYMLPVSSPSKKFKTPPVPLIKLRKQCLRHRRQKPATPVAPVKLANLTSCLMPTIILLPRDPDKGQAQLVTNVVAEN